MSADDKIPKPHEIVSEGLRSYLRWDHRHDAEAANIIKLFGLKLPRDRELIRQLTFVRVMQGPIDWIDEPYDERLP